MIGQIAVLTSCGKTDEVSQKMIDDINSLGTVTIEDEAKVQKLLDTYSTLTDKQKEQVTNYTILLDAQDTIDDLVAVREAEILENQAIEESKNEQILDIQREYYSTVDNAITSLKDKLKNPSTLSILEIVVVQYHIDEMSDVSIAVYYTAQNNLGADLDGYYHYTQSSSIGVESSASQYDTLWRNIANGSDSYYSVNIADDFYSHGEDLDTNTFGFLVDLEDYGSR